jgi:hypothetical protein
MDGDGQWQWLGVVGSASRVLSRFLRIDRDTEETQLRGCWPLLGAAGKSSLVYSLLGVENDKKN